MDPSVRDAGLAQALAIYVESLAIEARVAVFGDASLGTADRLIEAGARTVHVWDPDPERAVAAAQGSPGEIHVAAYPPRDPGAGPADLVLVLDLGLFDDPAGVVARARAMAGEGGVAVVRAINREAPAPGAAGSSGFDYYELFDLVAGPFSTVRMVAEVAFDGVALVTLGEETDDDAPAVNVDARMADGDRSAAAFVAVASEREIALDPYSIIELGSGGSRADRSGSEPAPEPADATERRLRQQAGRCAELEAELAACTRRVEALAGEVTSLRSAAVDAGAASAARTEELARCTAELQRLVPRVDLAEGRAAVLERELAAADEGHAAELLRFESALRERAQAVRSLEAELRRRDQIVRDLVSSLGPPDTGPASAAPANDATASVSAASGAPSAPGAVQETRGFESLGPASAAPANDATASVSAASGAPSAPAAGESSADPSDPSRARPNPSILGDPAAERDALLEENARLRSKLDALALDLARREADAHAAGWTVAELERRLAQRGERDGATPSGDPLSRALDEADALRRALAQEHAARLRVESGAAIDQACAEIQRLTVLLEQHLERERTLPRGPTEPTGPHAGRP